MIVHITCRTSRFNLSVVGADYINDCCFGEDFSRWLVSELAGRNIVASVVGMEDFGWANEVEQGGRKYFMNVAGTPDDDPADPDDGEWHILVERRRTLLQKVLGTGKVSRTDPLVGTLAGMLRDAGFKAVAVEP